jgi:hypothetical protein
MVADQSLLSHAARGRLGAAKRWGPQRVVRLDELGPEQRRLVLALIAAARETKEEPVAIEQPTGSQTGGTRNADRQSAA